MRNDAIRGRNPRPAERDCCIFDKQESPGFGWQINLLLLLLNGDGFNIE
jgi:hypothetical protein